MLNVQTMLAVAAGGAAGSVLRFWSTRLWGPAFPWGTLIINVTGSFLIGALAELFALRWDVSPATRVFLVVGICGGYTTFSTFSLDAYVLMEESLYAAAAGYVVASVLGSILALVGALHLIRMLP